jgi:hypothetical protein
MPAEDSRSEAKAQRLGAGRRLAPEPIPDDVRISIHRLETADGAEVSGALYALPDARVIATLMHPRNDLTHSPLVPLLLSNGISVWVQRSRSVGNDINLIHEETLLDAAAGMTFLRHRDFDHVVAIGHSGGGALYAYYLQQAARSPGQRVATTPAGRPVGLAECEMPLPEVFIAIAPHPGQGVLLLNCIDPSVSDEDDPLSVRQDLDLFDPRNGFADPPASSTYTPEFLARYRSAQRARVQRIDDQARKLVAIGRSARERFKRTGDVAERRRSAATRLIVVHRTDADPTSVDLSLDPSDRPYGSVFGRRPDITNYGFVGFGRVTTPQAWLSTWSGLSSNASFGRCGPDIPVPSLVVRLTGDQIGLPTIIREVYDSIGSADKQLIAVRGTHFGGPVKPGEPSGFSLALPAMIDWLSARLPLR